MLFDSDVIIWSLRGNHKAQSALKEDVYRCISTVTYIEVIRGLKTKERMQWWKSLVSELEIKIIPMDETISAKAMFWSEEFALSHSLELADSLIAATADTRGLLLLTGNVKDYKFLPGLNVEAFKP